MSENNENKNIDFDDDKEPIESIEKTVEDLKRKISELQEKEAEVEIPDFVAPEKKAKIEEIKNSAMDTVKSSINEIKDKANGAASNPELQKTIRYIKENAVKAVDVAKVKIDEIKNSPKVKEYADKTVETLKAAGEKAGEKMQEAGKYVDEHIDDKTKENLANAYDSASRAVSEGSKKVVTAANEFVNKPEVQEKIVKVRTGANDLLEKGSEAVKNLFSSKEDK